MIERWRQIPGYEGYYEVSDLGRVKSVARVIAISGGGNGYGATRPLRERILRQTETHGYPTIALAKSGSSATHKVHRLVTAAFLGACPAGMEVRHLDGVRAHSALNNLAYATHVENCADQLRHGTRALGEKSPNAKMLAEDVAAIKALLTHVDAAWLGRAAGASRAAINNIRLGAWREVPAATMPEAIAWLKNAALREGVRGIPAIRRGRHTAIPADDVCADLYAAFLSGAPSVPQALSGGAERSDCETNPNTTTKAPS